MAKEPIELTLDVPEHAFLEVSYESYSQVHNLFKDANPDTNWNTCCRGLGGTLDLPISSGSVENLMCHDDDRWWTRNEYNDGISEDILLHEFAHGIQHVSLEAIDPLYIHRLDITYRKAMKEGLWNNTYAASNRNEYFAIGSQDRVQIMQIYNNTHLTIASKRYNAIIYISSSNIFGKLSYRSKVQQL